MIQRSIVVLMALCFGQPVQSTTAQGSPCDARPPASARPFATSHLWRLVGDFEITMLTESRSPSGSFPRVHLYIPVASRDGGNAASGIASPLLAGWIVPSETDSNEKVLNVRDPNNPSITWNDDHLHIQTHAFIGFPRQRIPAFGYSLAIVWDTDDAFGGHWVDDGHFIGLRIPLPEGYFCARRLSQEE